MNQRARRIWRRLAIGAVAGLGIVAGAAASGGPSESSAISAFMQIVALIAQTGVFVWWASKLTTHVEQLRDGHKDHEVRIRDVEQSRDSHRGHEIRRRDVEGGD